MSSPVASKKRTINSFFTASQPAKRTRISPPESEIDQTSKTSISPPPVSRLVTGAEQNGSTETVLEEEQPPSRHPSYPHPIRALPLPMVTKLNLAPSEPEKVLNSNPDLDCLYYTPYISPTLQKPLFQFLRAEIPFYRVKYKIKRGQVETDINTPRFTTVFGLDQTSIFSGADSEDPGQILDAVTRKPVPSNVYKCRPRPIPSCLDSLKLSAEAATGETFNFVLVNYYANGSDSISYHSDDERFLGDLPSIASFSLGASRDFLLRHKDKDLPPKDRDLKLKLESGDMLLMRGTTQGKWLHSIPKRGGKVSGEQGRINITLRKAMVKGGTGNYYQYNVGSGPVYRWDEGMKEMSIWTGDGGAKTS